MKIEVVGKNGFQPSAQNKEYAEKKLAKIENFLDDSEELTARVVCKVYKQFHKVEITIPAKNLILRAEVSEQDLYAAIDKSIDKLQSQIRKFKTKTKSKMSKVGLKASFTETVEDDESHHLVRDKQIDLEPMTREEAIDQMELLGHDFFIYLDKETRKTNVIYLRDDGDYAIIETKTK